MRREHRTTVIRVVAVASLVVLARSLTGGGGGRPHAAPPAPPVPVAAWNKGVAIQAVTIHEPVDSGDVGGHLETHARNKVAAERAKTEAFRGVFGDRSPGEVLYDAAGLKPEPKVNPGDRAGPVDRTGHFRVDPKRGRQN